MSQQQAELLPTNWLQSLKAKHSEQQADAPAPEMISSETISDVADATIAVLQMFNFPIELIPFALAVVSCATGRMGWFPCADRILAERAMGVGDDRSPEAKKKWVQRRRDDLIKWQADTGFVLIECAPGGMRNNERFETQYCAHLLKFVYECINLARTPGGDGSASIREQGYKSAAYRVLPDAMKELAKAQAKHERFNRPRQDAEARINRNLRTSLAYLEKAVETVKNSGGDPSQLVSSHLRTIQEQYNLSDAHSVHTLSNKNIGQDDDPRGAGPVVDMTVPVPHKAMDKAMDTSVHSPSEQAVEIFESVGVESFKLLMRDERKEQAAESRELDASTLKVELPRYLERNARGDESLIIRPVLHDDGSLYKSLLIQIDEASLEVMKMLAPVSFLQIETSGGNGQDFLVVGGISDDAEGKDVRERLLRQLQPHGANGGAYGATRWPGSRNCKPSRRRPDGSFPIVKIVFYQRGRQTTAGELESLNLLAPRGSSPVPAKPYKPAGRAERPRQWPSYQIELDRAARRKDGKPDRSDADINFALRCARWGWSADETAAKLREVSERAKGRRDNYAERTARRAAQYIGEVS